MEKLLNKLKELIKEDEQIGTPTDMYSWAKQQGVLITRNDASYIVLLLERLAKVANEVPGTLPIFDVSVSLLDEEVPDDPILDIAIDIGELKHSNTINTKEFDETLCEAYDFIQKLVGNER